MAGASVVPALSSGLGPSWVSRSFTAAIRGASSAAIRVHLRRHRIDLLAQLHQHVIRQLAAAEPLIDGIDRLLRPVEIACSLARHLLSESRAERQGQDQPDEGQKAKGQKAASWSRGRSWRDDTLSKEG